MSKVARGRGMHAYGRRAWWTRVFGEQAVLAAAATLGASGALGAVGRPLGVAALAVALWQLVSLHHPSVVSIDDEAIAFAAFGRVHRYAWRDIATLRVRRFLVRDRILVRITPSPPFAGRYWLLDGIDRFTALVAELEARAAIFDVTPRGGVARTPPRPAAPPTRPRTARRGAGAP